MNLLSLVTVVSSHSSFCQTAQVQCRSFHSYNNKFWQWFRKCEKLLIPFSTLDSSHFIAFLLYSSFALPGRLKLLRIVHFPLLFLILITLFICNSKNTFWWMGKFFDDISTYSVTFPHELGGSIVLCTAMIEVETTLHGIVWQWKRNVGKFVLFIHWLTEFERNDSDKD